MTNNRVRSLFEQYTSALQPWQVKLMIARLQRYRVPREEWEDAMQELAIVVLDFKFDPAKAHAASEETLLCRRLDRCIKMLARGNARRLSCLDRLQKMHQPAEETNDVADDEAADVLPDAIKDLTPLQRQICQGLMKGQSVYEIAQQTGRAYDTIRRHVERIRRAFIDRGLGI